MRASAAIFKFSLLIMAVAAAGGCEIPKVNPESAKLAPTLPIADLHLHPSQKISTFETKDRMDKNNVHWAGAGARIGGRSIWEATSAALGERFIAFAGQTSLNRAYFDGGVAALEDADHPIIQNLLRDAEQDLKSGRIKGIGEIFVNNRRSNPNPTFRRKASTDAPSIRTLYKLVSKFDGFLTIHMEGDRDSLEQLERLLASDRRGRVLWNHCGPHTMVSTVRPLLSRNPNLFCELSGRYPPVLRLRRVERFPALQIFGSGGPDPSWLKLIEDFPSRFLIGTDAISRSDYDSAIGMVRTGLLPYLKPATARKVAYENAQQLFQLN